MVNPYLEITVKDVEVELLSKYYEKLKNYLELIERLRFEIFFRYVKEKRVVNLIKAKINQDRTTVFLSGIIKSIITQNMAWR